MRLAILLAAITVSLVLGLALWRALDGEARATGRAESRPVDALVDPRTGKPLYPSSTIIKADLFERLRRPPQVVIFGGSRALRVEPGYIRARTGLRTFNAATSNFRAEDAWAWTNYLSDHGHGAKMQVVWFFSAEGLRSQQLEVGLVEDKRFSRYFPADMIDAAAAQRIPPPVLSVHAKPVIREFRADGSLNQDRFNARFKTGAVLATAIRRAITATLKSYAANPVALDPQATFYFERTLGLMNFLGITPVIVLSPVQPQVLAAIRPLGWQRYHDVVTTYLASLHGRYRFELMDFSRLASIGGDPRGYFDDVHMKVANTRKVIDAILARDPHAFDPSR